MKTSGPTKTAEAVVAFFVPPACREEVLGDLYERYRSPGQYWFDALRIAPLVIASRVRRTADPQSLMTIALATYASFLGAAFWWDRAFLHQQWGVLRLAIPVASVLFSLMLEDAYSRPVRSLLRSIRGGVLGLGPALLLQPRWVMLYGSAMSLLLVATLRMLLLPATPTVASGHSGEPVRSQHGSTFVLKVVALVMIGVLLRSWTVELSPRLLKPFIGIAAAALILHQLNKRDRFS